jgi:CheY-like chemotaxis protein/rubrerythrin
MRSIIAWLKNMEHLAHKTYLCASELFNDDKVLSSFLLDLAEDENEHLELIGKASDYLHELDSEVSDITINEKVKRQIEAPMRKYYALLKEGKLTKSQLFYAIIEIEYSELNALFLYIINSLKKVNKIFQYTSSTIQTHKRKILAFYEAMEDGEKYLKVIKSLPNVWEKRVLIVEDNDMLREFYEEFLKKKAIIEVSKDGAGALKRTKRKYYDVIITDIEMPELNGIDFFKKAVESQPELEKNFIFCSGYISSERKEFLTKHNIPFLAKPIPIAELELLVDERLGNV